MFVIIEGLDGTGKTTFANDLVRRTDGEYRHHGPPVMHPLDEYEMCYQDYVPGDGKSLIVDRHVFGELVWPTIFGRTSQLDEQCQMHIEMFLRSRGALVVECVRDRAGIESVLDARDEPVTIDDLDVARDLFEVAFETIKPGPPDTSRHAYDFELASTSADPPFDFLFNASTAMRYANWLEQRVAPLHAITHGWIGDPLPKLLLVGDQVGPRTPDVIIPFQPKRGTSGHFMFGELRLLGDAYRRTAIVNASTAGEPEPLLELWSAMGEPIVIGLGIHARAALEEQGVPNFQMIPHPQYVRRFDRPKGAGYYAGLIAEAIGKETMSSWKS